MWFNPESQAYTGRVESAAALSMSAMGTIHALAFCVRLSMVIALCFKETSKELVKVSGCLEAFQCFWR